MNARPCLPVLVALFAAIAAPSQTSIRDTRITLRHRPAGAPYFTAVVAIGGTVYQPGDQPFAPLSAAGTWLLVPGVEYELDFAANCACWPDQAANASLGQQFEVTLKAVFDLPASVTWSTMNHRHDTAAGSPGPGLPYHNYTSMGAVLPWQDASSGSYDGQSAAGSTSIALVPTGSGPSALTLIASAVIDSLQETPPGLPWFPGAGYGGLSMTHFEVTASMTLSMSIEAGGEVRGESQSFPILPVEPPFGFSGATRYWFDPPLALGFDFQQTGSSLFTEIVSLPVGIDGDGMFEVEVGNQRLGQFAAGTGVDFRLLLGGTGVAAFRIVGIDPAVDATDSLVFPVQLAFDTPTAEFTMTPVLWRKVGSSCADPAICAPCSMVAIEPLGAAIEGNLNFGIGIANGPTNGTAAFFLGFGPAAATPTPLLCGAVVLPLQDGVHHIGNTTLLGTSSCDGTGSVPLPLASVPSLLGVFLTVQAVTLCPGGGLGLTHGIEFAIGN